jgi:hypothetical protein
MSGRQMTAVHQVSGAQRRPDDRTRRNPPAIGHNPASPYARWLINDGVIDLTTTKPPQLIS